MWQEKFLVMKEIQSLRWKLEIRSLEEIGPLVSKFNNVMCFQNFYFII